MSLAVYEAVVTDAAPEGAPAGHIKVRIPEIADDELPHTVAPLYAGWTAGGWHTTPQAALPETYSGSDEEVRVVVIAVTEYDLRWFGTSQYWSEIKDNAATRCGARSPKGHHKIIMDDDVGVQIVVSDKDATSGANNYLSIGADNVIILSTKDGTTLYMEDGTVSLVNSAGDTLVMDDSNGISIVHNGGGDLLAIEDGVAKLMGTDVQIIGGAVTITGQGGIVLTDDLLGLATTEKLPMMETFLTDLSSAMAEVSAIAGLGLPVVNIATLIANITTSLASGAPYLSTVTETA